MNGTEVVPLAFPDNAVTPKVILDVPSTTFSCNNTILVSVKEMSGNGNRDLTYQWIDIQMNANSSAALLSNIPVLEECATNIPLSALNVTYSWIVNNTNYYISHGAEYRIGAFTYTPNEVVMLKLVVNYYNDSDLSSLKDLTQQSEITFKYLQSPLVAVVDSTSKTVSTTQPITFDATRSFDPNFTHGQVLHSWTCFNTTSNKTCNIGLEWGIDWSSSLLDIPSHVLTESKTFIFTDNVTSLAKDQFETLNVLLFVNPNQIPVVSIDSLSTALINVDDSEKFTGYIQSSEGDVDVNWYLVEINGNKSTELDLSYYYSYASLTISNESYTPNSPMAISFTLPPLSEIMSLNSTTKITPKLTISPYLSFAIKITAVNKNGIGYALKSFDINEGPTPGTFIKKPDGEIIALETPIIGQVGDDWNDLDEDKPFSFRFGVRTYFTGNYSFEEYGRKESGDQYSWLLASTVEEGEVNGCNDKKSYQILVMVCDRFEACTKGESGIFTVKEPLDKKKALTRATESLQKDVANGMPFSALQKLKVIKSELCNQTLDSNLVDFVLNSTISSLTTANDEEELMASLDMIVEFLPFASPNIMISCMNVLTLIRNKHSYANANPLSLVPATTVREKRATASIVDKTSDLSEASANTLLVAYDILISKNQDVAEVYLQNIIDITGVFCAHSDVSKIKRATGTVYTFLQTQVITPTTNQNETDKGLTLAGTNLKLLKLRTKFTQIYSSYLCGSMSNLMCSEVCLATTSIDQASFSVNIYLQKKLFSTPPNAPSFNSLVSELRHVYFADSLTGTFLESSSLQWNISIPIFAYLPSNYYQCLLFKNNVYWGDSSLCANEDYPSLILNSSEARLSCSCVGNGIIGAFSTSPPTPSTIYPSYLEIRLIFGVNIQGIVRAIKSPIGVVVSGKTKVGDVSINPIERSLAGDKNARRMSLYMDKSLREVVGDNATAMAIKWRNSLASSLGISFYRIKSCQIGLGIVFTFTITVPFDGETSTIGKILSAEEIGLIISEESQYGEVDIRDLSDALLPVIPINATDIIELIVAQDPTSLMIILASCCGGLIIIILIMSMGLSFLKIKTDRLISIANNRLITINLDTVQNRNNIQTIQPHPAQINVDRLQVVSRRQ
uniref:REJ domain-containing protein n=1 Tax=Rhabditophanes sp. KR3021 TaxID=114890 RepID=A0AC35UE81_9BILA